MTRVMLALKGLEQNNDVTVDYKAVELIEAWGGTDSPRARLTLSSGRQIDVTQSAQEVRNAIARAYVEERANKDERRKCRLYE